MKEDGNRRPDVNIAQTEISIPGLVPEKRYGAIVHAKTGERIREESFKESNIVDKSDALREAIKSRPWLKDLYRDVRTGKKSAIVTVVLGGLVVTTAIGAGFEFGIRHGKDFKEVVELIKKGRK